MGDLAAFESDSNPDGHVSFDYGKVHKFNATIADTCGNGDCNNCCAKNSKPSGYLVDMEYYTLLNNYGTVDAASGSLSFVVYDATGNGGNLEGTASIGAEQINEYVHRHAALKN
eukprot:gene24794-31173_t